MSQEENCQKCNIQYLTSLFESKNFLKTIVLLGLLIWTHRRRKEREAKAKVVASVWGADFFQFLAAQEREFSFPLISGKLHKHACLRKKYVLIQENLIKICVGDF